MNTPFEHTVLAYLDGLLDRREEREFLKEVARDPSKRAVLDQYRKLDTVLKDRKVPIAVPIRAQQALAEKIPALQDVVPRTAPAAATVGGGAVSFFSRKIVTLLIGGGLTVGALTTLVLNDPFSSADEMAANSAVTEQTIDGPASADVHTTEQTDASGSDVSTAGTAERSSDPVSGMRPTTTAPRSQDVSSAAMPGGSLARTQARNTPASGRAARTPSSLHEDAAPTEHTRHSSTDAIQPGAANAVEHSVAEGAAAQSALNSVTARLRDRSNSELPLREIPETATEPPADRFKHHRPVALFRDVLDGRLYAYIETGAARQEMRGSGTSAKDLLRGVYLAGLRYDVSSHLAAGIEIGQSTFGREALVSTRSMLTDGSGAEVIIIDRAFQDNLQPWLRVHGLYTLNPADRLQFQSDAGGGLLLGSDRAFLFSAGLSAMYPLTYGVHARAGLHYSGTWLSPAGAQPEISPSSTGVIGIIRRANDAGTVYSSSLEFRIGFGILLW